MRSNTVTRRQHSLLRAAERELPLLRLASIGEGVGPFMRRNFEVVAELLIMSGKDWGLVAKFLAGQGLKLKDGRPVSERPAALRGAYHRVKKATEILRMGEALDEALHKIQHRDHAPAHIGREDDQTGHPLIDDRKERPDLGAISIPALDELRKYAYDESDADPPGESSIVGYSQKLSGV